MYMLGVLLYFVTLLTVATAQTSLKLFRKLDKQGFHRDLITKVTTSQPIDNNCRIIAVDTVPSGAFIDPDELRRIASDSTITGIGVATWRGLGELNLDTPTLRVDIEAQKERSEPFTFVTVLSQSDSGLTWESKVPIHLRYHRAEEGVQEYAEVQFTPPQMCVVCPQGSTAPDWAIDHKNKCSLHLRHGSSSQVWPTIPPQGVEEAKLIAQVPIGSLEDNVVVQYVTVLFTMGGSLFLSLYALCFAGR